MEKRMSKTKHQEIVKFERDENGNMTYAPFKANGKTFKFIRPGDPIGIAKWSEYQKLQIVVGGGVTFADLIVGLREHKKLLGSDQSFSEIRSEAIVWADSTIKGLIDMSQARYDKAFYLASIFIYEDGKDSKFGTSASVLKSSLPTMYLPPSSVTKFVPLAPFQ